MWSVCCQLQYGDSEKGTPKIAASDTHVHVYECDVHGQRETTVYRIVFRTELINKEN